MSDDWQVGDLALCVDNSSRGGLGRLAPSRLRAGAVYTVLAVEPLNLWKDGTLDVGLVIDGPPNAPNTDWLASRFRKIRPHTPDAEDAETIRLLNSKPAQVPA